MSASITFTALFPSSMCSNPNESMFFRAHTNVLERVITPEPIPIPESSTLSPNTSWQKE